MLKNHPLTTHLRTVATFLIYSVLGLLCNLDTQAQSQKIDSLRAQLEEVSSDTAKIDILTELALFLGSNSMEEAKILSEEAIELSLKNKYPKGHARGLQMFSAYYANTNPKKEDSILKEALSIAEKNKLIGVQGKIYNSIAINAERTGRNGEAILSYQKALNKVMAAKEQYATGIVLANLAFLHLEVQNYSQAEHYLEKLVKHANENNEKHMLSNAFHLRGNLFFKQNRYKEAIKEYEQAYQLYVDFNDKENLAHIFSDIAAAKIKLKEFDGQDASLLRARNIFKTFEMEDQQANTYNLQAAIANAKKLYSKSLEHSKRSMELLKNSDEIELKKEAYYNLAQSYEGLKNPQKAVLYYKKFIASEDAITQHEKRNAILEAEYKLQMKETYSENLDLKQANISNQSDLQSIKNLNWLALIALGVGGAWIYAFWNINKKNKNYNQELEIEVQRRTNDLNISTAKLTKSNEELENFAYVTSHDLKEPLNNIMTFNNLVQKKVADQQDEDLITFTNFIEKNTMNMRLLIENILEFSKLTHQDFKGQVDLEDVMQKVEEDLHMLTEKENAKIEYGRLPVIAAHPAKLFQIFKNLVENGLKYNNNKFPKVSIGYTRTDDKHIFQVKDNGIGIPEKFQKQIFHMFKRLHNREEYSGSGMGLPIAKKAIEVLGGDINLRSTENLGTLIEFWIPTKNENAIA